MEVALAVLESSQRIEGLLGELIALTRASVSLLFSSLHQFAPVSNTAFRRSLALLLLLPLLLLRLRRSGVGWTPPPPPPMFPPPPPPPPTTTTTMTTSLSFRPLHAVAAPTPSFWSEHWVGPFWLAFGWWVCGASASLGLGLLLPRRI
jgi:hypothetical protein